MEPACELGLTGELRSQQVIDNAAPYAVAAYEHIVFAGKWLAL